MEGQERPPRQGCHSSAACEISEIEGRRAIVNDLLVSLLHLGWEGQVNDIRWLLLSRSKVRQEASWVDWGMSLLELVCLSQCHLGNFLHLSVNAHSLPLRGTQQGLLPLPLPSLRPVVAWVDLCAKLRGRD